MKNVLLVTHRKQVSVFVYLPIVFLFLFMSACFASSLPSGRVGQASSPDVVLPEIIKTSGDACPTREEIIQKTQKLHMPFIANDGQTDERVKFYANTFGGTVFVTRDGEIVYALSEGRGGGRQRSSGAEEQGRKVVSGWHGQAPLVHAESEFVANGYSPLFRADNANCPPDRILTNALLAAYLPRLQEGSDKIVGTRCPVSPRVAHFPGLQEGTDKQGLSMPPNSNPGVLPANYNPHSEIQNPQSPIKSIALKETIVGAKIGGITGEQPAVTKVNYFTGNDESKWKTNVPTYDRVNLGEVYKGIELSLKAYGDNVEKLFCVKPGASAECIKVQLDGSKSLQVNQEGQLEADTDLGMVKFTRPIAYQEIEGKRVKVECKYTIAECRM